MSRARRVLAGLAAGYSHQIVATAVGLWLTAFLLRRLGQSEYGLWLIATQILAYLLLADLGVVAIVPRETASSLGRAGVPRDQTPLSEYSAETVRVALWQVPFVALSGAAIVFFLPEKWAALRGPLAVLIAVFTALFPFRVFQGLLTGLQELAFLGLTQTWSWVLGTSVTVVLVLAGYGLYGLTAGWTVAQIVSVAAWRHRLRRRYPNTWFQALPSLTLTDVRRRIGRGLWASAAQVAQALLQGTDLLLIGSLLGPAAVVPYYCTGKLIGVLANQPSMIVQAAGPALSELRAAGDREHLKRVMAAIGRTMLIASGAIVCVVLLVNEAFVTWWVGQERYAGLGLTVLLLVAMILRHINTAAAYAIFAFGHDRRLSLTTVLDGLATVGVGIVLVRHYGSMGAPMAGVAGACLVSLPGNLSALGRELAAGPAALAREVWPWLWRFALLGAGASLLRMHVGIRGLSGAFAAAAIVGLAYLAVMWPLALKPPLADYVRPRLTLLRRFVGLRQGA